MTHNEYLQMIEEQGYIYLFIETTKRDFNQSEPDPHVIVVVYREPNVHLTSENSWRDSGLTDLEAVKSLMERFPEGDFENAEEQAP
ncbi:hypothetical protein [Nocardiopsis sp. NPDC006938]|uniref:hypothetical protein n=1 Tax=Nocardiopsis sp. NPDC006938 TaxID=3364337 RepID=UPI0036A445A0